MNCLDLIITSIVRRIVFAWFFYLLFFAPLAAFSADESTNELSGHASAYLAMHGKDPVHWQVWQTQALLRARRSGKLIFISSGYFSCHWCHVMQRESYRDPEIAKILNRAFVAVKVDRELNPVLDDWLMEFVQETRGHGGWPLNVFLTPQGHPLIGTLYMKSADFKVFLLRLEERWDSERQELSTLAAEAARGMERRYAIAQSLVPDIVVSKLEDKLLSQALESADELAGGFGHQAKFPLAPRLATLLARYRKDPSPRLREFLTLTLRQMMSKGLFDHLGSGFFRYTVDPYWRIPHFEKMLYANAQLVGIFLQAGDLFSESAFEQIALSTLDFMLDEMLTDEGAFVAALSAVDDQGREGGYYLWDNEALVQALTVQEVELAKSRWALSGFSEFKYGHLPIRSMSAAEVAEFTGEDESRIAAVVHAARQKLLAFRAQRRLPVDDKLLSSWNGLALVALTEGAKREPERYAQAAQELHDFIVTRFRTENGLTHAIDRDGEMLGPGTLEDYANISRGLLAWARFTAQDEDLRIVAKIIAQAWDRFHTEQGWRMAETTLIPSFPARYHIADGNIPSPSATLLEVSLEMFDQPFLVPFKNRIRASAKQVSRNLMANPLVYASHVDLLSRDASEHALQ